MFLLTAVQATEIPFQFPEDDYIYRPYDDVGFSQYQAPSLHQSKKVVLTFDDGPHPTLTPALLDILKKYEVKATFFILAEKINENTRPIVERMLEDGHIVASQDWNHDNSNTQNKETYKTNLRKSILAIEEIIENLGLHRREMYYRFPYGDYGKNKTYHQMNAMKEVSHELYQDNCLNFAFWDIDTADWVRDMSSQDISDNIMAQIFGGVGFIHWPVRNSQGKIIGYKKKAYKVKSPLGGGVILMHDIHQKTVDSVEVFLKEFQKKNIQVIELNQVKEFSYENKECVLKI